MRAYLRKATESYAWYTAAASSAQQEESHLAASQRESGEHVLRKQAHKDRLLALLPLILLYFVILYKYFDVLFVAWLLLLVWVNDAATTFCNLLKTIMSFDACASSC